MEPLISDDVFMADPAAGEVPERLARFEGLMTDDERARQARFVFARDRAAFAVTRALVRTALSRYAAVAPRDWRFAPGPHGRPRVVGPAGIDAPTFSVSHTAGAIACLVTREARAAIDVERLRPMEDALAIAERHFAPAEVAALRACAGDDERQRRFFSVWTLKEAYLKAVGRGLSLPLQAVSFAFEPDGVESRIVAGLDPARVEAFSGDGSRWDFQLWRPTPDHRLALARATAADASPPSLRFFRVVPLDAAEPVAIERLAATRAPSG